MSGFKGTPGPWATEELRGEINVISNSERDSKDMKLGVVYVLAKDIGGKIHGENFDDYSEVEANARLIAAAPELLEALEQFVAWVDAPCESAFSDSQLASARAAIAKAIGEE